MAIPYEICFVIIYAIVFILMSGILLDLFLLLLLLKDILIRNMDEEYIRIILHWLEGLRVINRHFFITTL